MILNIGIKKHQIEPIGKVLDVGCGQYPFINKNCRVTYIDLYPDKNVSRQKDLKQVKDAFEKVKIVTKMNAEKLNFRDKFFDYVVAGDILEHTKDPEKACKEIIRVGKAGFIRCPTILWEILFGRPYHFWAASLIDKVLIFHPKNFKSLGKPYNYREMFGGEDLHCSFEWTRHFQYKVLK